MTNAVIMKMVIKSKTKEKKRKIPIAVPVMLCPECYKPMEILGRVDVEKAGGSFSKNGLGQFPILDFVALIAGWNGAHPSEGRGDVL